VGFFGFASLNNFNWVATLSMSARVVIDTSQDYGLSVIPLFILMGNLITQSGLSNALYKASYAFLGHLRGGLAMATVVACGGFSAICGSSLATAATMAKVSMPPMRKYGYSDSLAAASIAAGGTLGILIPPSVILVIYGIMTEQSIRELFAAGFLPGMLGIVLYVGAVAWTVWRNPQAGPKGDPLPQEERSAAFKDVFGIVALFGLVMGGIYGGLFTPTEAAGVGAGGALLIALLRRSLTWRSLYAVLAETTQTSASLFMVVIGALIFSAFVNRAGLPDQLVALITSYDVAPLTVIFMIIGIYLILGCVLESLSMLLLTVPIFYPIVQHLGFDLVWFGILVVIVTEISLITPPVGLNVFVLSGVLKDTSTKTIFKGIMPFIGADIIRLLLITLIPAISLILPELLYR
jgi:tripartite ATP-independent transporter DctM subunit